MQACSGVTRPTVGHADSFQLRHSGASRTHFGIYQKTTMDHGLRRDDEQGRRLHLQAPMPSYP